MASVRGIPRIRVTAPEGGKLMVKQSLAEAQDINVIIDSWRRKGEIPVSPNGPPVYGDFSGVSDFHTALGKIEEARAEFEALPAKVRKACDNDPGKFLELVFTAKGRADLEAIGLVEAKVPPGAPPAAPQEAEGPPGA